MTHLLFLLAVLPSPPLGSAGRWVFLSFPGFTARTLSIQVTMSKPPRAFAWLHQGGGSRAVKADETSAASVNAHPLPSIPVLGEQSSSVTQPWHSPAPLPFPILWK